MDPSAFAIILIGTSILSFEVKAEKKVETFSVPFLPSDAKVPTFDLTEFKRNDFKDNEFAESKLSPAIIDYRPFAFVVEPDIKQHSSGQRKEKSGNLDDLTYDDMPVDDLAVSESFRSDDFRLNFDPSDSFESTIYDPPLQSLSSDNKHAHASKRAAEPDPFDIKQASLSSKTTIYGTSYRPNEEQLPAYPQPELRNFDYPQSELFKSNDNDRYNNFFRRGYSQISNVNTETYERLENPQSLRASESVPKNSFQHTNDFRKKYHNSAPAYSYTTQYHIVPNYHESGYQQSFAYKPPSSLLYEYAKPKEKLVDILRINDEIKPVKESSETGKSFESEFSQSNSIIPESQFLLLDVSEEESDEKANTAEISIEEQNNSDEFEPEPVPVIDPETVPVIDLSASESVESEGGAILVSPKLPSLSGISQSLPDDLRKLDQLIFEGELGEFGDTGRTNQTFKPQIPVKFTIVNESSEENLSDETSEQPSTEVQSGEISNEDDEMASKDEIEKLLKLARTIFEPQENSSSVILNENQPPNSGQINKESFGVDLPLGNAPTDINIKMDSILNIQKFIEKNLEDSEDDPKIILPPSLNTNIFPLGINLENSAQPSGIELPSFTQPSSIDLRNIAQHSETDFPNTAQLGNIDLAKTSQKFGIDLPIISQTVQNDLINLNRQSGIQSTDAAQQSGIKLPNISESGIDSFSSVQSTGKSLTGSSLTENWSGNKNVKAENQLSNVNEDHNITSEKILQILKNSAKHKLDDENLEKISTIISDQIYDDIKIDSNLFQNIDDVSLAAVVLQKVIETKKLSEVHKKLDDDKIVIPILPFGRSIDSISPLLLLEAEESSEIKDKLHSKEEKERKITLTDDSLEKIFNIGESIDNLQVTNETSDENVSNSDSLAKSAFQDFIKSDDALGIFFDATAAISSEEKSCEEGNCKGDQTNVKSEEIQISSEDAETHYSIESRKSYEDTCEDRVTTSTVYETVPSVVTSTIFDYVPQTVTKPKEITTSMFFEDLKTSTVVETVFSDPKVVSVTQIVAITSEIVEPRTVNVVKTIEPLRIVTHTHFKHYTQVEAKTITTTVTDLTFTSPVDVATLEPTTIVVTSYATKNIIRLNTVTDYVTVTILTPTPQFFTDTTVVEQTHTVTVTEPARINLSSPMVPFVPQFKTVIVNPEISTITKVIEPVTTVTHTLTTSVCSNFYLDQDAKSVADSFERTAIDYEKQSRFIPPQKQKFTGRTTIKKAWHAGSYRGITRDPRGPINYFNSFNTKQRNIDDRTKFVRSIQTEVEETSLKENHKLPLLYGRPFYGYSDDS